MELSLKSWFPSLLGGAANAGKAPLKQHTPAAKGGAGGKAPEEKPPQKTKEPKKGKGLTVADRRRMARRALSFTDLLPYVSYSPEEQVFAFKDGMTLGAMFELSALPTEAQSLDYLIDRAKKMQEALQALPEPDGTDLKAEPWVVQFFLNDDRNLDSLPQQFRDYIAKTHEKYPERANEILSSPLTQTVIDEVTRHMSRVSTPDGLFVDTQVTGQVWRGQQRRVRCCIYRRFANLSEDQVSPAAQIDAVAVTLTATMHEVGVKVRRCTGRDLYEWLLPFFNRRVPWALTDAELLRSAPYPGDRPWEGKDGQAPIFGLDFSELLNLSEPVSDLDAGLFEFDGVPVKAMALQSLRSNPQIGHFSAELMSGKEAFARFDRLPAGSMLSISVAIQAQYKMSRHIEKIRDSSRAKTAAAQETHRECLEVLERMMAQGDKLFPMNLTLYVTGNTREELEANVSQVRALLTPTGLHFVQPKYELAPLDVFMRGLPFNFDLAFDTKYLRRTQLTFASQIAALVPVYGRSRGTPHPNFWFWNRGGEPLWCDPIKDRKKNAHMLVLGPTGAGKSATLNYLSMMTMAVHKPRLVIVDAGKSFSLMMDFFKEKGLTTHSVTLTHDADVSLPPFVNALRVLDDRSVMDSFEDAERMAGVSAAAMPEGEALAKLTGGEQFRSPESTFGFPPTGYDGSVSNDDDEEEEKRDLIGEMLIAAELMITGGEPEERMRRADKWLVTRAIIRAAQKAKAEGRPHPLTHDVAIELQRMHKDPTLPEPSQLRASDMGQAMMTFASGLRARLFDRYGQDWPDADVTLVEMGTLTQDGYEDALGVAYTSLLDSVQSRGERFQGSGRPLVFLTDEGHLITTNELLGPKIAKGTKMWRKLDTWFWLATQNLKDFPGSMERVLSMCEYWMLLTMDKAEIEEVSRFRQLTREQRLMMESACKEPPKYTEGVLISDEGQMLFRNVPPALPIALAMTDGHEKAHRKRLMDEHGCSEMEAAFMVARELEEKRG